MEKQTLSKKILQMDFLILNIILNLFYCMRWINLATSYSLEIQFYQLLYIGTIVRLNRLIFPRTKAVSCTFRYGPAPSVCCLLCQVCREFQRGGCKRTECRFAHPGDKVVPGPDNTVTVCMDALKGRCARDPCRYYHPPLHLQAHLKAAHSVC